MESRHKAMLTFNVSSTIQRVNIGYFTSTPVIHRNAQTEAISVLLHLHANAIRLPIVENNSPYNEYPFNTGTQCATLLQ